MILNWFKALKYKLLATDDFTLVRKSDMTTGNVGELYYGGKFVCFTLDSLPNVETEWFLKRSQFERNEFTNPLKRNRVRLEPKSNVKLPATIRLTVLNRKAVEF